MGRFERLPPAGRAAHALRRHGPHGTAWIALRRLRRRVRSRERHVWFQLALGGERPRPRLPRGFELRLARDGELDAVAELPGTDSVPAMRRTRGQGNDLWVVDAGGRVAFACWIFHGRTPVAAARGGWIDLPPGIVCIEDCTTAPPFRGRGVAPAAYSAIAARLEAGGVRALVTKIDERNRPSRRAVQKAGFREVATMTLERGVTYKQVDVKPMDDELGPVLSALIAA